MMNIIGQNAAICMLPMPKVNDVQHHSVCNEELSTAWAAVR